MESTRSMKILEKASSDMFSDSIDSKCSGVAFVVPRNVFMKSTVCFEGFVCIGKPPHGMPRILCTADSVKWNLKPFLSSILQVVVLNCIPNHSNMSSNMQSHEI